MDLSKLADKVKSMWKNHGGVKLAFGEPVKMGELDVIPVARVHYGFGYGGGGVNFSFGKNQAKAEAQEEPKGTEAEDEKPKSDGFGAGGGGSVTPIGFFTVKGDKTGFFPVVSFRDICAIFSLILWLFYRIYRKKLKAKK